jgi:hypothetical protein
MKQEESILLYIIFLIIGLVLFVFLMRWVFRVDKIIKYQAGIIAVLFDIAKKQGVSNDRIESIDNYIKH